LKHITGLGNEATASALASENLGSLLPRKTSVVNCSRVSYFLDS